MKVTLTAHWFDDKGKHHAPGTQVNVREDVAQGLLNDHRATTSAPGKGAKTTRTRAAKRSPAKRTQPPSTPEQSRPVEIRGSDGSVIRSSDTPKE